MKIKFKLLTFIVILFSTSYVANAQHSTTNKIVKTLYSYSFNAEMDAQDIQKMEKEIAALKNVTEAKVKYKAEQKSALLIVVVQEKPRSRESDVLFQPINLKRIISKKGYMPKELKTEVLTK